MIEQHVQEFLSAYQNSLSEKTFSSLSLGNYQGTEADLKHIYIKQILVKRTEKLSFTYRYKTRDIVKNFTPEEAASILKGLLPNDFNAATLFTTVFDLQLEIHKSRKSSLKTKESVTKILPSLSHDHIKNRLITSQNKAYLSDLKITDPDGNVYKNAQDKYRQINHYVEILSTLIKDIPVRDILKVVDMGSGKGYLTFALYDYLRNVLNQDAAMTGVEFRPDLVELCNGIAGKAGFEALHFEQGTIGDFDSSDTHILIALHACDTATDDAIFKGITAGSDLIVVAPCCHKQIRREIEKNKAENDVNFLTRHGIFLERQSEMVTDGIRAMILEYAGYKTKVFEFVGDAHTPKNVMITGIKEHRSHSDKEAVLQKIKRAKEYFGIEYHHLERLMGI